MRVRLYLCVYLFTFAMMSLAAVTETGPDDRVVHLMQELTEAPSPSGEEGAVRAILMREFSALGANVSTDGMGNVIAVVPRPANSASRDGRCTYGRIWIMPSICWWRC